jgi:hypothetical protein
MMKLRCSPHRVYEATDVRVPGGESDVHVAAARPTVTPAASETAACSA